MSQQGYGLSITFHSGFCAKILSATFGGIKRNVIDLTNMATPSGWMVSQPSDLSDMGDLDVDLLFNPSTSPPVQAVAENITVTFPIPIGGNTAATWQCSGYMTEYTPTAPLNERMTAKCKIHFSGVPTFTAGT